MRRPDCPDDFACYLTCWCDGRSGHCLRLGKSSLGIVCGFAEGGFSMFKTPWGPTRLPVSKHVGSASSFWAFFKASKKKKNVKRKMARKSRRINRRGVIA